MSRIIHCAQRKHYLATLITNVHIKNYVKLGNALSVNILNLSEVNELKVIKYQYIQKCLRDNKNNTCKNVSPYYLMGLCTLINMWKSQIRLGKSNSRPFNFPRI